MGPINSSNDDADQVLVEENSHGIKVLLNRPNQLNALSFQMISRILELFLACEEDCNVKLIILKGKGRAFSSGGDVSAVVRNITKGNWKFGAKYFQKEYILNYVIATYSKPQVSILNGIVMGGGAGASIHGRFRVATENSIREGRVQGVGQCLVREYRMVCNVIRGEVSKDFVEGCRAILLDKDKNPKWEPSKLELVSDDMVDHYFSKVDDEDWEDLKLPTRSNLPVHAIAKL